ncbi:MAG TPA: helix-turn-helix domain-containing protein [Nitrosopumilaceae archaeon]|nr:helix-turn-helix domain-containing protein [Nitrosopumilaceae archaeon]
MEQSKSSKISSDKLNNLQHIDKNINNIDEINSTRSQKRSEGSKVINSRTIYPTNNSTKNTGNTMNHEQIEMTAFDSTPDSGMYDYRMSLEKLKDELSKFGLTANQSKVYIYLGKYGSKTAPEACRALKIPRTETYHLLTTLQNKGIVSATFQHPIRFSALPLDKAVWVLVNAEKERVKTLEKQEKNIVELWNGIPDFKTGPVEAKEDKFQMLQGVNQINSKIHEMITKPSEEILILGSEKDFLRFYHSDFLEPLNDSKSEVKILTSCSEKTYYIFDEADKTDIKLMPPDIKEDICYIIRDDELIFFMKNASQPAQHSMAMWTDSSAMVQSMRLLFNSIWSNSKGMYL